MPLFARSYGEFIADTLGDLSLNTNITRLSAGGKARAILETVGRRTESAYDTFDLNLARAFVSTAQGQYLDLFGELLGVDREKAEAASVTEDMQVQRFYVDSGTFGTINNSQDLLVPEGTIISSEANERGILYKLTSSLLLPASASEAFAAIEATVPGADSNIGVGELSNHNFTRYTDSDNASLLTANLHSIANGRDFESDTNYRYRIVNRALEAEAANVTAIRLAGLSVAGVADVIVKRRYKGIGTFGVIIQSVTPTVSDALIAAVRAKVEAAMAAGEVAYIEGPSEVGITIRFTIYYKHRLDTDELDSIEADIEETIVDYVNSLDIGDTFSVNRLVADLFSVSEEISTFGEPGKPIDEIYIYRNSKLEDNRIRETLLGDYVALETERVIMEPSVQNQIVFSRQYTSTSRD